MVSGKTVLIVVYSAKDSKTINYINTYLSYSPVRWQTQKKKSKASSKRFESKLPLALMASHATLNTFLKKILF